MQKSCLVIGGSGFLGGYLVNKLLSMDYKVTSTYNSQPRKEKSLDPNLSFCKADICERDEIEGLFSGLDYVFLCVNISPVNLSKEEYKRRITRINTKGVHNVAQCMIKYKTKVLVFLSSVAAMGAKTDTACYDESTSFEPEEAYGKSKLLAEKTLQDYYRKGLIDGAILRPSGIYGPGGFGPLGKIVGFLNKGFVPIIGNGENLQSIVYVGNVANAAIAVAETNLSPGAVYVISDNRPYSVNEMISTTARIMGKKYRTIHFPVSIFRFIGWALDCISLVTGKQMPISRNSIEAITVSRVFKVDKIKNVLDFKFEFELEDGLRQTIV